MATKAASLLAMLWAACAGWARRCLVRIGTQLRGAAAASRAALMRAGPAARAQRRRDSDAAEAAQAEELLRGRVVPISGSIDDVDGDEEEVYY